MPRHVIITGLCDLGMVSLKLWKWNIFSIKYPLTLLICRAKMFQWCVILEVVCITLLILGTDFLIFTLSNVTRCYKTRNGFKITNELIECGLHRDMFERRRFPSTSS